MKTLSIIPHCFNKIKKHPSLSQSGYNVSCVGYHFYRNKRIFYMSEKKIIGIIFLALCSIPYIFHAYYLIIYIRHDHTPDWASSFFIWIELQTLIVIIALLFLQRWRVCSFSLVALLILDTAFGYWSAPPAEFGPNGYLPQATSPNVWDMITFHPILQGIPRPNYKHEGIIEGKKITITEHNSLGMRRSLPILSGKPNIAVLGGSTTYGTSVYNGEVWVDILEQLNPRYQFLNMGAPGYSSAEHLIQTAFYLDPIPDLKCVVYYMGWNDILNANIPNLDPGYADYHMRKQAVTLGVIDHLDGIFPLVTFAVNIIVSKYLLADRSPPAYSSSLIKNKPDPHLDSILLHNIEKIILINTFENRKTVIIGQLLDYRRLTGNGQYGWLPLVLDKDVPMYNEHANQLMKNNVPRLGGTYLEADQNLFTDEDFLDQGHFTVKGNRKFAELMSASILKGCGLPQ